jgi:peptidoglycan/LPS O-acetylase OafA/YrhL
VLLVALNHARVARLSGGYVGVDVFFVISGFLITGWLIKRTARSGRVPFAEFYAARARRILPAATLTLVVTAVASYYLLNYVRALSTLDDCVWAAFFAANVHFAQVGTDYFARANPPSPVQQFWTLAVEEQFYLVWPAFLAVAIWAVGLRRGQMRGSAFDAYATRRLTAIVSVGVLVSLAYSTWYTPHAPTNAYFSTLTRGWELGVGVLLALTAQRLGRMPDWVRVPMTWAGLAAILIAGIEFTSSTEFPGYAALLPVLGAALVIAGGIGRPLSHGVGVVLGRKPLRLIGDTSYAFYLWHWPVLIIAAQYEGHQLSVRVNLLLLGAAFCLSAVTYYLFENPIRHSDRLAEPRAGLALWPVAVSATILAVALGTIAIRDNLTSQALAAARPGALPAITSPVKGSSGNAAGATPYTATVAASVTRARERMSIPYGLSPPLEQLAGDAFDLHGCQAGFGADTSGPICQFGDGRSTRTLVVVGDSHAQMWMAGLSYFASHHHWKLIPLIKQGCEPTDLLPNGIPACKAWYGWARGQTARLHPQAIVLSQAWSSAWQHGDTAATAANDGLAMEITGFRKLASKVLLVEDIPPNPKNPVDCLLAHGATFGSCAFHLPSYQLDVYKGIRSMSEENGAIYLPTLQWFCADADCPTVVGTTVAYQDQDHLSATYGSELAKPFAGSVSAALLRSR